MYELPFQILEKLKAKPEIFRVDYQSLSENYRAGQGTSLTISQAFAYAIGRLPATCSVINFILSKFFLNYESFTNILDVVAGCGALPIVLQNINIEYEAIEKSQKMVQVFQYLLGKNKKIHQKDFLDFQGNSQYDAVFASYAVNEFVDKETALKKIFELSSRYVFIIEPGTPRGYENILSAKRIAENFGAHAIFPCSSEKCSLSKGDWCHFSVRVHRSKNHITIKNGCLPYEDEKFCFAIFSKNTSDLSCKNIIIKRPIKRSGHIIFDICTSNGICRKTVPNRKLKEKFDWGDELRVEE